MIGGIGGYGAAMSRAAYQSYNVRQDLNETLGNISAGTATNFRRSAVNAGISNTVKSQLVGWQNADRVNTKSLTKLDFLASILAKRKSLFDEARTVISKGTDTSLEQSSLNALRDEALSLQKRMVDIQNNYVDSFGDRVTVDILGTPTEIPSIQRLTMAFSDEADDYHYNYMRWNDMLAIVPLNLDDSSDASTDDFLAIQSVTDYIDTFGTVILDDHPAIPDGYDRNYSYYHKDSLVPFKTVQAAQEHAQKMTSVLEGAVSKLNALDYEVEVTRMRKLQQQETQAMSAMQIANQGMQTYVQALANTNAGIGRLVRGAF